MVGDAPGFIGGYVVSPRQALGSDTSMAITLQLASGLSGHAEAGLPGCLWLLMQLHACRLLPFVLGQQLQVSPFACVHAFAWGHVHTHLLELLGAGSSHARQARLKVRRATQCVVSSILLFALFFVSSFT